MVLLSSHFCDMFSFTEKQTSLYIMWLIIQTNNTLMVILSCKIGMSCNPIIKRNA